MIDDDTAHNTIGRNLSLLRALRGRAIAQVTRYEWVEIIEEESATRSEIFQHGEGPVTLEFLGSGDLLQFWRHESLATVSVCRPRDKNGAICPTADEVKYGVVILPIEHDEDFVAIPGTELPPWAAITGREIMQINLISWLDVDQGGLSIELAGGNEIIVANALIGYELDLLLTSQLTSDVIRELRRQPIWSVRVGEFKG
jgi:hypothetical protein